MSQPVHLMEDAARLWCEDYNATFIALHTKSMIEFVCKCGTPHSKSIRVKSGALCVDCTARRAAIQRIQRKIDLNKKLLGSSTQT